MERTERDHHFCQYLGYQCSNERAHNRSGTVILLCEKHRALANRNQQRYRLRQRQLRLRQEYRNLTPCLTTQTRSSHDGQQSSCSRDGLLTINAVDDAIEAWFVAAFGQQGVTDLDTSDSERLVALHEFEPWPDDIIQALIDIYSDGCEDQVLAPS